MSAFGLGTGRAYAQTGLLNQREANFASHEGNIGFLALGVFLPLLRDGKDGQTHTLRAGDSVLTTTLIAEGIKYATKVERPDGTDHASFPSGHATAAFAVAAAESAYHPREAPLWIAGAALIADSRVTLHRHRPVDVIGGALLGWGGTRAEFAAPRGLLIAPFVSRDKDGRLALSLHVRF